MQSGSGGLVYAIAGVCGLRVILFAALSRFCRITAIASRACVLASPKYRARCRPNRRFIVPKHCSTRNRRFEIRLLKRFPEARSGRLAHGLSHDPVTDGRPRRALRFAVPDTRRHTLVGQHALRPRPFNHRAEPRASARLAGVVWTRSTKPASSRCRRRLGSPACILTLSSAIAHQDRH